MEKVSRQCTKSNTPKKDNIADHTLGSLLSELFLLLSVDVISNSRPVPLTLYQVQMVFVLTGHCHCLVFIYLLLRYRSLFLGAFTVWQKCCFYCCWWSCSMCHLNQCWWMFNSGLAQAPALMGIANVLVIFYSTSASSRCCPHLLGNSFDDKKTRSHTFAQALLLANLFMTFATDLV